MSSSANEDQELSNNAGAEDSDFMTIEFLRARLLSERSISKTARQRAAELAKRVIELEEQLKYVTFQRKKAEKATSEVLAILENCGVNEVSEVFDSCSDESKAHREIIARNGSNDIKYKKNEPEAYSSSEFEYTQSTGRSLSWKSSKNSQYSVEKKKYGMEPAVRRRTSSLSVPSNISSARRVGKSCRKVRRRDTRSPEELQTDGLEQGTCHTELSNCSDGGQYELREIIGGENENSLEQQNLCSKSEAPKSSRHLSSNYEVMESAEKHQVQLIGQYEAEEKAQNEWEETFRKNNTSSQQDSCDIGNHSDVTEERYGEIKSPELLHNDVPLNSKQETNEQLVVTRLDKEPPTSGHVPPRPVAMSMSSQKQNFINGVACEPSSSEISFPTSQDIAEQELSRNYQESSNELIVAPPKTANDLASVLEELQRAKLSLNHKLNPPVLTKVTSKPEIDMDGFKIPLAPPGLFRLPTDYQYLATTITNHPVINEQAGFSYTSITGSNNFLPVTSVNSRTAFSGANHLGASAQSIATSFSPEIASNRNLFRTVPSQPANVGIGTGLPPQMYLSQPRTNQPDVPSQPANVGIGTGLPPQMYLSQPRTNQSDAYAGSTVSTDRSPYPYFVNMALHIPLNEGNSRTFSSSESVLPRMSLYDDLGRRNVQI